MIVQLNLRADILKSQHKQVILWVDITIKNHFFWIPGSKLKGRRGSGKTEGTVYGVCLLRVDVGRVWQVRGNFLCCFQTLVILLKNHQWGWNEISKGVHCGLDI